MSEGKKNLKNLRDRLGVNKDAAPPAPAVGGPPGLDLPAAAPPGLNLPANPPPGVVLPVSGPPGLELPPQAPSSQPSAPQVAAPVYIAPEPPKPVVIKGNIDDETAALAGLKGSSKLSSALMVVIPVTVFAFIGHIIGNMMTEGGIISQQKDETSELWKKIRGQDEAILALERAVEGKINQKMKAITPDSVSKDATDFFKSINTKNFYPDDGLFLPTTPLIDNGKKDTDPRFVGQTLEYIDVTSQFLVQAQLHSIVTERDKANLDVGFKKILTRIKELTPPQEPEPDLMVKQVVGDLPILTQAPYRGYGIELLDGNKARLVIIKEIEKDAENKNKAYTIYDAKYGAVPPTDAKEIRKIEDKTKVAMVDRGNARTFLLTRETMAVENFFTRLYYLKGASTNMRKNREEAAQALENALKAPGAFEALPANTPATPAAPAPTPAAAPEGDEPTPPPADPAPADPKQ